MSTKNILLAGFGGQGILFAGKVIAYAGLIEGKEISWLPSYGPEMRGGTANCSVCISDEPIGSPLVTTPDILAAMNVQSYDKFIDTVAEGGIAVIDSTLVNKKSSRTDINAFYIPATQLANDNNLSGLANIIIVGKILKESGFADFASVEKSIEKCVPASKKHLLEANIRAIKLGMEQ
ncbi:MAG TPA: 2-oxoacid:ferredoxin oxidoreductase subunit gamma [Ruminococcaceae bacterium]|nr:2-oxoacid:ferredoxin oxidoreductase subunit gamma [Oscillospiraceae bacterium]